MTGAYTFVRTKGPSQAQPRSGLTSLGLGGATSRLPTTANQWSRSRASHRRPLVAAVLEGVRRVHHDVLVGETVVILGRPGVARIHSWEVLRLFEELLEFLRIGRTVRLHSV